MSHSNDLPLTGKGRYLTSIHIAQYL